MLLAELVRAHAAVAATRSRLTKRAELAAVLRAAAGYTDPDRPDHVEPDQPDGDRPDGDEVEIVASYLSGRLRQRRTGVGWRSLADLPPAAPDASLTPRDVDDALEAASHLSGPGSAAARTAAVTDLFGLATADEQGFLRGLVLGELRQGALDSLLLDAVADAADVPVALVRRAAMFSAESGPIARAALTGGADALERFALEVGRPVRPMLASSAPDVATAVAKLGGGEVVADVKLDGIRVQVHKLHDEVWVLTRSLDDVTARLPEIVALARSLDVGVAVLDGEALALDDAGRPRPFQETASRAGTHDVAEVAAAVPLTARFFDVLHADGVDLVDAPARERLAVLDRIVPAHVAVPRLVTDDVAAVEQFFAGAVAGGYEGLVVKDPAAPYAAGRRGAAWVKVKPRHTLDLVVLAVERGSGRREGTLSNIHLGARDGDGFVLLGKTFKGMTDEMLAWQTGRFRELQTADDGWVVTVRPVQVVEIAFDGVQRSTRYPGGVALRFARVLRYRDDKPAAEADTIDAVRAHLG
ncbi:ATP-dependent DNA ligase [Isoptericola jiangsuensis]|uniref:ATP-dependent DNA ligase n=1 Tax=Isoptericola jiangsuensis TaxID=548579 RepID=UPI003AAFB9A4